MRLDNVINKISRDKTESTILAASVGGFTEISFTARLIWMEFLDEN